MPEPESPPNAADGAEGTNAHSQPGMISSAIRQNVLITSCVCPPCVTVTLSVGRRWSWGHDKSRGLVGSGANPQLMVPAPRKHHLSIGRTRTRWNGEALPFRGAFWGGFSWEMGCRGLNAFHYLLPSKLNHLQLPAPVLSEGFHPGDRLQDVGHISLPSFQLGKPCCATDFGERQPYSRIHVAVPLHPCRPPPHSAAPCVPRGPPGTRAGAGAEDDAETLHSSVHVARLTPLSPRCC